MPILPVEYIVRDKVDAYEDECDYWQADHEKAMLYFDFRDLVADGISLFSDLCRLDENWRESMLKDEVLFDQFFADKLNTLLSRFYRTTKSICEILLPKFEASFGDVERSAEIRSVLKELECIATADHEFFTHEKFIRVRDQALSDDKQGLTIECDFA